MSEKQKVFVHPFLYFITDRLDEIYNSIMNHKFTTALRSAYWFCKFLDPKIIENLKPQIEKAKEALDGKIPLTNSILEDFVEKIMYELHEAGYFLSAKIPKEILIGGEKEVIPR